MEPFSRITCLRITGGTIHIYTVYFADAEMVCHELTGSNYKYINLKLHDIVFSLTMIHGKGKVSRFLFAMITYNISDLFRENTNNCKNGEEAHNETIRAYGAMGFLKLE